MTARSYDPMDAARHHLDEARRCLERNQKGVAASEAYYAMYHVVAHAAESRGDTAPKTHEGMEWYFFHELVQAGPLSSTITRPTSTMRERLVSAGITMANLRRMVYPRTSVSRVSCLNTTANAFRH